MTSHRFDSFIAFLTVDFPPFWEVGGGGHDNTPHGSLKPHELSTVCIPDGQRINPGLES